MVWVSWATSPCIWVHFLCSKLWYSIHSSYSKLKLLVLIRLVLTALFISSSPFLIPLLFLKDENLFVIKNFILVSLPKDLVHLSVGIDWYILFLRTTAPMNRALSNQLSLHVVYNIILALLKIIKLPSVFFAGGQDLTCFAIYHRS